MSNYNYDIECYLDKQERFEKSLLLLKELYNTCRNMAIVCDSDKQENDVLNRVKLFLDEEEGKE